MSHLKQMLIKKASVENLTSSKKSSPQSSLLQEGNHFFNSKKKKQPFIDKKLKKNLVKRLQPFGIESEPAFIISKKNLYFFQLAAFFETKEQSWIQIHPNALKPFFVKLYPLDEILAHEKIHQYRKDLQDPSFFEEWLAYRTSRSLRKYIGPYLTQLFWFALTMNLAIISNIFVSAPFFFLIPIGALAPIFLRERILFKAKKRLGKKYLQILVKLSWKELKALMRSKKKKSF